MVDDGPFQKSIVSHSRQTATCLTSHGLHGINPTCWDDSEPFLVHDITAATATASHHPHRHRLRSEQKLEQLGEGERYTPADR